MRQGVVGALSIKGRYGGGRLKHPNVQALQGEGMDTTAKQDIHLAG